MATPSGLAERREILALGTPAAGAIPAARTSFRPLKRPGARTQGERLTPQFGSLQDALSEQRAELVASAITSDPELVAVFDLAGSEEGFMRAAAKVPGLEFLVESQEDYVDPDDDFYYEATGEIADDGVPCSLYMVMSDARAVTELVRLFGLWQDDQSITFERGLNPLKNVFGLLRSVRKWGPEDRVRETGLLEAWQEDVEMIGAQGYARVEVELWYRDDEARRRAAEQDVVKIISDASGRFVNSSSVAEIAFHSVLADIPYNTVEQVLRRGTDAIDLLQTESVMFVSAHRPMAIPVLEPVELAAVPVVVSPSTGLPRIALLDGLPLENHEALRGRVLIDDPDDRGSKYAPSQQSHGTAMASLIIHGDLSDPGTPLAHPIYVHPILEPHTFFTDHETVPTDESLVDVVHRAFRRVFEGGAAAVAPSVRVFNLSIGDPGRQFVRRMSPLARLVDWLSHHYNVIVVVSAGNTSARPVIAAGVLGDIDAVRRAAAVSIFDQARTRRLLSPAEAVNAITVGALHEDRADPPSIDGVIDLIPDGLVAAYSPVGFGYRRSVKPEVLLPGGREFFINPPQTGEPEIAYDPAIAPAVGPGLRTASPGMAGSLNSTSFSCGTSNAAALATRALGHILEELETLEPDDGAFEFPDPQYHPVLAKALLVHAARWGELQPSFRALLNLDPVQARRKLTQILGYGRVHIDRVASASPIRAVVIGAASISKDVRHTHVFPLPPSLAATTEWRRLTVTLAWLTPVNPRSQKYRMARLSVTPPRAEVGVNPIEADRHALAKGTVQHHVLEGKAAVGFTRGDALEINVDCRVDAGRLAMPVRYAIAASLEMGASVEIDIHDEIRSELRVLVRERTRERITLVP